MRRRQDPKIKLTVYVSHTVASQLDLACKDRTKNKSKLTETALARLLSPQRDDDNATPRRLDRLSRDFALINRHQQIALESLGLFIRHYFTLSLPLPQSEQQAAHALGQQRFQRFIEQLGRRLAGTTTLLSEITEQLATHAPKGEQVMRAPSGGRSTEPDVVQTTASDVRLKS